MPLSRRDRPDTRRGPSRHPSLGWAFCDFGIVAAVIAVAARPADARSAAAQVWPPFVLVAGLLLVGLVAEEDGLFAAAGRHLARTAHSGVALFVGAALLITLVTATLNLDTSVAFLTPVLVYATQSRNEPDAPLLVACLLLSNAGSLFLPGSNLTNLIVLGHGGINGGQFFARMWLPALTAVVVTTAVIAWFNRHHLGASRNRALPAERPVFGLGLAAIVAATIIVLVSPSPAIPVAVIGGAAVLLRVLRGRESPRRALEVLGVAVLLGLFGVAVAFGTLGRAWSGPASLLAHLDAFGTAAAGALTSVLVNNLPAASLLGARAPAHPMSLLIGLNLGPNLFASGSLAWFLWLRAARAAGAQPSIRAASRIGVVAVPLAVVAATGMLVLTGYR